MCLFIYRMVSIMRRFIIRLLRLRNIVLFTLVVILLYVIRTVTDVKTLNDVASPVRSQLKKMLYSDHFVPSSLKVCMR